MPLILISTPDTRLIDLSPFKIDVNTPAMTITNPCPIANRNNISPASARFALKEAKPIIPANIGVEHGVEANAKTMPIIIGYKTKSLLLFCGICLMNTGIWISNIPKRLSPIRKIIPLTISPKTAEYLFIRIFPPIAQIKPSVVNTNAIPSIKNVICISVFILFLLL